MPTENDLELVRKDFEQALQVLVSNWEKILYTQEGRKRIENLYLDSYKKFLPADVNITVIVES